MLKTALAIVQFSDGVRCFKVVMEEPSRHVSGLCPGGGVGRRRRSLADEGDLGSAADPSRQSMVRTEVGVLHEVELVYGVDDGAGA